MINCLIVGMGGFAGAVMRYMMTNIPVDKMDFPHMTLLVNILGSLLIGIVVAMSAKSGIMSDGAMLFLKVGLCGGFTTFSSFALETQGLIAEGNTLGSIAYVIMSITFCVLAVFLGEAMVNGVSVMLAEE